MKKPIEIAGNKFTFKKDALEFYKKILNSYEFGEILNSSDFDNVYGLIEIHPQKKEKLVAELTISELEQLSLRQKVLK